MTTNGFQGMDVEYAQHAARSMDGGVSGIQNMSQLVGSAMENTLFHGEWADAFREDWHGTFTQQLNGVRGALEEHSTYLKNKTAQQIETSNG